jgi:hypothetical protein
MVLQVLRDVYGYPFKDIAEYFEIIGVIPPFLRLDFDPARNDIVFKYNPEYDERSIAIMTITELIAGAEYDRVMFDVVLKLLEKIATKRGKPAVNT